MNKIKYILAAVLGAGLLSSCSTGTPELSGLSPQAQAEIIKSHGGIYKVGKPYKIAGRWYYPKEDYNYSEVGTASWYGEDFNGKPTANGECYNMNTLTAAHRTLPLPSIVRVTNLQNGRSIILRVNDRGPYVKDRIIDLSKRGAQLLGYIGQGTTKVKVEIMEKESRALKQALLNLSSPNGKALASHPVPAPSLYESSAEREMISGQLASAAVYGSAASADGSSRKTGSMGNMNGYSAKVNENIGIYGTAAQNPDKAAKSGGYQYVSGYYYVHAGSFTQYDLAHKLMVRLKEYGNSHIVNVKVGKTPYYRVSVGPYSYEQEAKVAQAKLKYYGVKDARIEKK